MLQASKYKARVWLIGSDYRMPDSLFSVGIFHLFLVNLGLDMVAISDTILCQ